MLPWALDHNYSHVAGLTVHILFKSQVASCFKINTSRQLARYYKVHLPLVYVTETQYNRRNRCRNNLNAIQRKASKT